MQKTITWKTLPKYTTNFNPFSEPPNNLVFIRLKDFTYDRPEEDWKEKLRGVILPFNLKDVEHRYCSGHYDRYGNKISRSRETFDSEYHFVQELIDEAMYPRLIEDFEFRPNWWDWEEVEVEEGN